MSLQRDERRRGYEADDWFERGGNLVRQPALRNVGHRRTGESEELLEQLLQSHRVRHYW